MSPEEPTRYLRVRLTFARNPDCYDTNGEIEHWEVCVWEVRLGTIKWPFEVTGVLDRITIPERWDGFTKIPRHDIRLPGVKVDTQSYASFGVARARARDRALCLSGYMERGLWLFEECYESPHGYNGPAFEIHEFRSAHTLARV